MNLNPPDAELSAETKALFPDLEEAVVIATGGAAAGEAESAAGVFQSGALPLLSQAELASRAAVQKKAPRVLGA